LPDAKIVYATVGRLNDAKDNVILAPTWGSGSPDDVVGLLTGTGRALDPEKYFIVIPNHFGGGYSSGISGGYPQRHRIRSELEQWLLWRDTAD
jgi:homoserine O-acetyltransferase